MVEDYVVVTLICGEGRRWTKGSSSHGQEGARGVTQVVRYTPHPGIVTVQFRNKMDEVPLSCHLAEQDETQEKEGLEEVNKRGRKPN